MTLSPTASVASASPPTTVVSALHIGRRDHYRLAADILDRQPRRVVLMQRSSSLLLGPEEGWDDEAVFYRSALRSIAGGARWFHIASTVGIDRHLRRPGSRFPHRRTARERLRDLDGAIGLGADGAAAAVKGVPPEQPGRDLKVDRQARLLLADFGDDHEAVNVIDVGDRQCSVHYRGPYARDMFELCADFWRSCPPLTWEAFERCGAAASSGRGTRDDQ